MMLELVHWIQADFSLTALITQILIVRVMTICLLLLFKKIGTIFRNIMGKYLWKILLQSKLCNNNIIPV